jgi:hypothetical protein
MYWKYKKTGKRQQIFTMENNLNWDFCPSTHLKQK